MYVDIVLNSERTTPSDTSGSRFHQLNISSNAKVYTMSDLDIFVDDIRGVIRQRLENYQKETQESGWIIKDIAEFKIFMCRFAKEGLGDYSPYPKGLRGSNFLFNPCSEENSLLIALASHQHYKEKPGAKRRYLARRLRDKKEAFWKSKVNVGYLSHEEIGLESLYELEELNKVSILLYNLISQREKYRLQLVYKSKLNYEIVPLLLIDNSHVCYIKNFISFYNAFRHREPITDLCLQCLTVFENSLDLEQHKHDCNLQTIIRYPIIQTLNHDVDNVDEEVSVMTEEDNTTMDERSSSSKQSSMRNKSKKRENLLMEVDMKDKGECNDHDGNNGDDDNSNSKNSSIINSFIIFSFFSIEDEVGTKRVSISNKPVKENVPVGDDDDDDVIRPYPVELQYLPGADSNGEYMVFPFLLTW